MVHSYRKLQHWNQWLSQQFLGKCLLDAEKRVITPLLEKHFGKHALLIGVSQQYSLLEASAISCHSILSPIISREIQAHFDIRGMNQRISIPSENRDSQLEKSHRINDLAPDDRILDLNKAIYVEGDFHELPILTGSIDLVMLPHTLEFVDNPRQLLSEACRIIKPEGLIVICGFNPYSAWGVKKFISKQKMMPWQANFIHSLKIKNWLRLVDFALEKYQTTLFTPPFTQPHIYKKLQFFEGFGHKCLPALGGVYILLARAKVIPLMPIRLSWKQKLGGIRISTTISGGHIAR